MLGILLAALLAASALCDDATFQVAHESTSEAQMKEHLADLQRHVHLDTLRLPRLRTDFTESSCFLTLLMAPCEAGTTFTEEKTLLPLRRPRDGDVDVGYQGRFVYDENDWFNVSVFVKREVLRRARNTLASPVTLTREKSLVTVDSTTEGWTVGAQLSGSYFGMPSSQASHFVQGAISVSASYSSHTTTGTQISVSDASSFVCAPNHVCRSELWTTYVRLTGVCQSHPTLSCHNWSADPCAADFLLACDQLRIWRNRFCKPQNRVDECEIVTPVMEAGNKPYAVEVFFEEPIRSLHEKPRMTGYKSGLYLLGSENRRYDPDAQTDPYWTPERGWHSDKVFPTLNTSEFPHKVPRVTERHGRLHLLDTDEWYDSSRKGDDKYFTESKKWYAKPTAPPPSLQDMARFDGHGDDWPA